MIWKERPFTHLRPSTVAESIDRVLMVAFRFAPILFAASLVGASDYALTFVLNHMPGVDTSQSGVAAMLLLLMLLGDFAAAVGFLAVFQGILFPLRPISPKALLRTALRKLPGYFFTQFFYLIAVTFFAIVAWGCLTSKAPSPQRAINLGFGLAATAGGIWVAIRLCLAPIVSLIEETSPFNACRRSMHLTSNQAGMDGSKKDAPAVRWMIITILPMLIVFAVGALTVAFMTTAHKVSWPMAWRSPEAMDLRNVFAFLATFLAAPFYRAGLMGLYIEYRMRHEALDFYLRLRESRRRGESTDNPLSEKH